MGGAHSPTGLSLCLCAPAVLWSRGCRLNLTPTLGRRLLAQILLQVRAEVVLALDAAQQAKTIGSPLEADVELTVPKGTPLADVVAELTAEELAEIFIVSRSTVVLVDGGPTATSDAPTTRSAALAMSDGSSVALGVRVGVAGGEKCGRCWRIEPHLTRVDPAAPGAEAGLVCGRCNFGAPT